MKHFFGKIALSPLMIAVLLLAAAAFIACGPAAGEGEKEGDPAATATAAPTETPKSEEEPTKTPIPLPTEKPSETPKPTPTRHPDDPPSPTATPVPTYPPTTTPDPGLVNPVIRRVPHPDGVQGCRSINIFAAERVHLDYLDWCGDALEADVKAQCSSQEGPEAQLRCAREHLSNTQWPVSRLMLPCSAITNADAGSACVEEAFVDWAIKQHQVWEVWPQILNKVDSDGEVKVRKQEIAKCMLERGYDEFDVAAALPWQIGEKPDEEKPVKRYATTAEERAAMRARYADLNECALKSGIYDVQEALWFAEVRRLEQQDPSSFEALLDFGLKEALEREGPASFLTFK